MLQVPSWKFGLRGEVLGREALPLILPSWEDLAHRSAEDNVYYAPRYAQALLETIDKDSAIAFAAVWGEAGLIAMLPFTTAPIGSPLVGPAGRAWRTKFTFSCMPLLDRFRAVEAAHSLLEVLAGVRRAEWIIPTVNAEGAVCAALTAALARQGRPWLFLGGFKRASLASGATFEQHLQSHFSSKRRRELARNRRRLEQLGKVEHESHRSGAGLDRAVSAFLSVEAAGWKGHRGTALACNEDTREFAMRAFTGDASRSICRADVLALDGRPIAVSLLALSGRTGFTVKTAFDERYRSYAAGLLLEIEVIRSFLSGNWASRLDAATAGAHVIDDLWPGRVEVADLAFSLAPRHAAFRLSALRASEEAKRSARAEFKRWRARMVRA